MLAAEAADITLHQAAARSQKIMNRRQYAAFISKWRPYNCPGFEPLQIDAVLQQVIYSSSMFSDRSIRIPEVAQHKTLRPQKIRNASQIRMQKVCL